MSTTESPSNYRNLEHMSVHELLVNINQEDKTVAAAVGKTIHVIEKLVEVIVKKMNNGGRLFYIGAGTSGRLGVVDASEIPPTYGMPHGKVIGLIAGGDAAIRKAVENAEDDPHQAWNDLLAYNINTNDVLIGIAASGSTPYVIGGLIEAQAHNVVTACITCNTKTELARHADFAIEAVVGPEFVTGSTRMKAGTAQKLVLNMISTTVMVKLGRVKGNKMVDMQLTNKKLISRATRMIMEEIGVDQQKAEQLLAEHGSVRKVIEVHRG